MSDHRALRHSPSADEGAITSQAQARFFRDEAGRHRADAERERTFAGLALSTEARSRHLQRARRLDAWAAQSDAVAASLEGTTARSH